MRKIFADRVYEALGPDLFRTQKAPAIRTSIRRPLTLIQASLENNFQIPPTPLYERGARGDLG